jgi:hypothetical protein
MTGQLSLLLPEMQETNRGPRILQNCLWAKFFEQIIYFPSSMHTCWRTKKLSGGKRRVMAVRVTALHHDGRTGLWHFLSVIPKVTNGARSFCGQFCYFLTLCDTFKIFFCRVLFFWYNAHCLVTFKVFVMEFIVQFHRQSFLGRGYPLLGLSVS